MTKQDIITLGTTFFRILRMHRDCTVRTPIIKITTGVSLIILKNICPNVPASSSIPNRDTDTSGFI